MKKKYSPLLGKLMGRILPGYAILPLIIVVVFNFLVFIGTRFITDDWPHYDLTCSIDRIIPFWPPIVVIYVLAFAQWIIGYILIGRSEKDFCYRYCAGDIIAKVIGAAFFLLLPTIMTRPVITGTDLFSQLTQFIYNTDAPTNLFPSFHCLESWICLRSAFEMKRMPGWMRGVTLVMSLLVFASTVLLKQHVFVDILGGIAAAEIGLQLAHRSDIGRRLFGRTDILY